MHWNNQLFEAFSGFKYNDGDPLFPAKVLDPTDPKYGVLLQNPEIGNGKCPI